MSEKRKYFILSDLHLEFRQGQEDELWNSLPYDLGVDTCIVAGDLTSFGLPRRVVWNHFRELCNRFTKVIYVPGNHEYYGSSPETVEHALGLLANDFYPVLTILSPGIPYTYKGQRFLGGTMWFPDRPEVHMYRRMINDSVQIKGLFPWAFTQSGLFIGALCKLCQPDDIVVTHHVPTDVDTKSVWKLSPTQAYFVNRDAERYFENVHSVKPKAWIYGHTHDKHQYILQGTKFICNPLGYPGETGTVTKAAGQVIYEI